MRGRYSRVCLLLALSLVAGSALADSVKAAASSSAGRASELVGKLQPAREEVRTLPGGVTLRIAAGSVIERERSTRLPLGRPGAPKTPTHVVRVVSGRLTVSTPKSAVPSVALLVHAPRKMSAVISSGRGEVVVTRDSVTVGALEGEMLTAIDDQWRTLPAGKARSVDASAAKGTQRAILPAPVLRGAPSLLLAPADGSGSFEIEWTAVPQAASYAVTVHANETALRHFNVTSNNTTIEGLGPGRYTLAVSAVDRYGLNGKASLVRVRALGLELPAGARQLGGAIEIGRRQRILFTDPDGLEVTYGSATAFVRAPKDIGLVGGRATRLRVRAAGEAGELKLQLLPAEVHAGITLVTGPRGWPREAGKLRIAFRDGQGRLLARAPEPSVEVRVNRLPVRVAWQRRGGLLEATLPAHAGWGPHSVAIRVKDKSGVEIGREVLNIAAADRLPVTARRRPTTAGKRL